jgi:hypothetical protein
MSCGIGAHTNIRKECKIRVQIEETISHMKESAPKKLLFLIGKSELAREFTFNVLVSGVQPRKENW